MFIVAVTLECPSRLCGVQDKIIVLDQSLEEAWLCWEEALQSCPGIHFAKVVLLVVVDWKWDAEGCQSLPSLVNADPIQALCSAME